MAREAILEINCSRYSERIIDVINLFNHNHLDFYRYALHICGKSNPLFIIKAL